MWRILAVCALMVLLLGEQPRADVLIMSQDASQLSVLKKQSEEVQKAHVVSDQPANMLVSVSNQVVYLAHSEAKKVTAVALGGMEQVQEFSVDGVPFGLAETGDGRLFVGDWTGDRVLVFNTNSGEQIGEVRVGKAPAHLAITPDGIYVFVVNREENTVSVIDTRTLSVAYALKTARAPFAIVISPDGESIFVAAAQDHVLHEFSTKLFTETRQIKTGAMPYGLTMDAAGEKLAVSNQQAGIVTVFDTNTWNQIASIKVGRYPEGLTFSEKGDRVYVANWFSADISVLDIADNKEVSRIKAPEGVRMLARIP